MQKQMEKKLQDSNTFRTTFAGSDTAGQILLIELFAFFFFQVWPDPSNCLIIDGCFKDEFSVMNWKATFFFCLFLVLHGAHPWRGTLGMCPVTPSG